MHNGLKTIFVDANLGSAVSVIQGKGEVSAHLRNCRVPREGEEVKVVPMPWPTNMKHDDCAW
jgi:hypothetical protein